MKPMRLTAGTLAIAFFTLTLCGAGVLAMQAGQIAHVSGCPFSSGMSASCPLTAIHQLENFSTVLGTLPVKSLLMVLFAITVVLIVRTGAAPRPHMYRLLRMHDGDDARIWRPLQYAFSRGILNPKVY